MTLIKKFKYFIILIPISNIFQGIEMCERLSTMAIIVNLVTYLVYTMHMSSASASNFASTSGGTSYLLCLFGGIVADSFLGRYWTIVIATAIHAGVGILLACEHAILIWYLYATL